MIQAERRVDEGGRGVKEDAEIEGGHVVSLDSVVLDGHIAVVVGPGVHVPAAVGRVQHVREARFLQPVAVQRGRPGRKGEKLVDCRAPSPGSGGKLRGRPRVPAVDSDFHHKAWPSPKPCFY